VIPSFTHLLNKETPVTKDITSEQFQDSEYTKRLSKRRYDIRGAIRLLEEELDDIEALLFPQETEFLKVSAKSAV
jgi:hypothetical protein